MDTRGAIRAGYAMADMICQGYLGDLTDAELMVRAVPGINHIAWQLGHIISSEHDMVSQVCPGVMPALPADRPFNVGQVTSRPPDHRASIAQRNRRRDHALRRPLAEP